MGGQMSELKTREENIMDMHELHNKYRAAHGVNPLELDETLSEHAQEWAEKLESWGKLEESAHVIGENCFLSSTHFLIAAHAVNVWYSERFAFNWQKDYENQPGTEHFTQIIWKDTRRMGAGYKTSSSGTYIVAVYVPPGNIPGHFSDNIQPVLPSMEQEFPSVRKRSLSFNPINVKNLLIRSAKKDKSASQALEIRKNPKIQAPSKSNFTPVSHSIDYNRRMWLTDRPSKEILSTLDFDSRGKTRKQPAKKPISDLHSVML